MIRKILAAAAVTTLLSGCASVAITPVNVTGFAYTNMSTPLLVTASQEKPTKVGRATVRSIMGFYASGDASVETAARNGGISRIHHVDVETQSILGVIADVTTVVYGN